MKNNIKIITSIEEFKENLNISDVSGSNYSSNPKDHNKTFETWDELFEFQARKDGANICEVPYHRTLKLVETL
jgi:hypothetical protein